MSLFTSLADEALTELHLILKKLTDPNKVAAKTGVP